MNKAEVQLALKIALLGGVALLVLATGIGWATGGLARPAFVCKAKTAWCTPVPLTPTIRPTYTPYPTATPVPPTLTPTPTRTPPPTPTPTPSPLYQDLLAGCESEDFDFAVEQTGPVDVSRAGPSARTLEGLETTYILTNTGTCRLVGGQILDLNTGVAVVGELPLLFNPGQSETLTYTWPPLEAGHHVITLTLRFKTVAGTYVSLPDREFVLTLNVTLILDRDRDGVPDVSDACPNDPGPEATGGCPDVDGDGVVDADDCCPDTPGVSTLGGCPDNDSDGFVEQNDRACPNLHQDMCPGRAGALDNGGCPNCKTVYDRCEREKCTTDQVSGDTTCTKEQYDCNPHEVCEP